MGKPAGRPDDPASGPRDEPASGPPGDADALGKRKQVEKILRGALLGVYASLYDNRGQAELAAESAAERLMAHLPEGELDPESVADAWEEELEALARRMPSEHSVGELAAVFLHHLHRK